MEEYSERRRKSEEERKKKRKERQERKRREKERKRRERKKRIELREREQELRRERREIRERRHEEDERWRKCKQQRKKRKNNPDWKRKKAERRKLLKKRKQEDREWKEKRKKLREQKERLKNQRTSDSKEIDQLNALLCILLVVDNCTRYCFSLSVLTGEVTAEIVVKVLKKVLPKHLRYLISDNGRQFIADVFEQFCIDEKIKHIRISPYRAQTNGIAERLVRTVKEMLASRRWSDAEELQLVLNRVLSEYNNRPHQGINGYSPNKYREIVKKYLVTT